MIKNYIVKEEIWFGIPHRVIYISYIMKKIQLAYLILGDGLIPLHKDKSIDDREIVWEAKNIIFGKELMKQRMKELMTAAK